MNIWALLAAFSLPSAVGAGLVGLFFRRIEKRLDKEDKEREAKEATRREFEAFQTKGLAATMALCKANALALQNGRCNGETHAALEHMEEVKHDQRDFLVKQGIDHIF